MKGVIMAGGEGTRLRPLTVNRPKPMVPFCNKPLVEHVIELLKVHGVKNIVITLHYLPESVMSYFGGGREFDVEIQYCMEERPLGTAGGVKNAEKYLDEAFVVISGDVFTNINLAEMLDFHKKKGSLLTIALRRALDPTQFGIALLDGDQRVVRYLEKPSWDEVFSDLINMGIYIIEPEILQYIPEREDYDFSKNLFPKLLESKVPIYGWIADEYYWSDIGNHVQYMKTHRDALDGKAGLKLNKVYRSIGRGVWIGRNVEIEPPVLIGDYARIRRGAKIGAYSIIGNNTIIEPGVRIENSIIWDHTYVGYGARISGAIAASKVKIGNKSAVCEGAVVGDEVVLGEGSVIKPNIKIWPSKIIDPFTTVSSNLKWGIRWYKSLFEPWGITGLVNIEITPELATRIGLAIGSWLEADSEVVIGRDTFVSSRMIKRAIISGLIATGVRVYNIPVCPLPVLTHYVKTRGLDAGIVVTTPILDPQSVRIKIFDSSGMEINNTVRKKINDLFFKEEYRRVLADRLGTIMYPTGYVEAYLQDLLKHVNVSEVSSSKLKAVLDCGNAAGSIVAPALLEALGVEAIVINSRAETNLRPRPIPVMVKNINIVSQIVRAVGADVGFVLDADADRVVIIDENGRPLEGDVAVAFLAIEILKRKGPGKVVVPISASYIIDSVVERACGKVVRAGLGSRSVVETILREGAVFGGDDRGAFVYPDFHPGFDGLMTMAKVVEIIAEEKKGLSEIVKNIPEPYMVKKRIAFPLMYRGLLMRKLHEELREREIDTIDGIKIVEGDGWVFIHPVANEPIIEIVAEAPSIETAEILVKQLMRLIEDIRKELKISSIVLE